MKNKNFEKLRKAQQANLGRNHWKPGSDGLFVPHDPVSNPASNPWPVQFGFVQGGRAVLVWCSHPREAYQRLLDERIADESDPLPLNALDGNSEEVFFEKSEGTREYAVRVDVTEATDEMRAFMAKEDALRKRIYREDIGLEVGVRMKTVYSPSQVAIMLTCPVQLRSRTDIAELAAKVRSLRAGRTTLEKLWPGYRYTYEDWMRDLPAHCPDAAF